MPTATLAHLRLTWLAKSVAGSADVTLSETEAGSGFLKLTGALTGSISLKLPVTGGFLASGHGWWIWNATSGAFTLTFIGQSGTGVLIPQGFLAFVAADGTNLVLFSPPVNASMAAVSESFLSIALADANTTLTAAQYFHKNIAFTGTLTAGRDVVLPNVAGATYAVFNNGTGQILTFKVSGQTGVAVADTKTAIIRCNGTDYKRVTADA